MPSSASNESPSVNYQKGASGRGHGVIPPSPPNVKATDGRLSSEYVGVCQNASLEVLHHSRASSRDGGNVRTATTPGHSTSASGDASIPSTSPISQGQRQGRLSSVPAVPSPLGPRRSSADYRSDLSGLMSTHSHTPPEHVGYTAPPPIGQIGSRHGNFVVTANHTRRGTDPFVERDASSSSTQQGYGQPHVPAQSTVPSLANAQYPARFHVPSVYGARAEDTTPSAGYAQPSPYFYPPPVSGAQMQSVHTQLPAGFHFAPVSGPQTQGVFPPPTHAQFSAGVRSAPLPGPQMQGAIPPQAQSSQNFTFPAVPVPRADLPIPPPLLPGFQGTIKQTPKQRARHDSRNEIRAAWIKEEGKLIADLNRAMFAAAQKFSRTNNATDHAIWQKLADEFTDATNLEKQQEKRRNLFFPEGMQAARTGPENIPRDGHAGLQGGPGKLLGGKMALMERQNAERIKEKQEDATEAKKAEAQLKKDQLGKNARAGLAQNERYQAMSEEERKNKRAAIIAQLTASTTGRQAANGNNH
ncbi:hypothetical protein BDV95DRAFT_576699 [Massariosphaeria phaeospora]|uniref:Uncharacterized protein n=1 Tax=Massariosphaeria phaeospora TaxID=100035 RepID=A0A7C8I3I7_9PLEO|nr:hypothetical protein BDV95DRAFT_576699 [Massariosphaeria phaeospora]